LLARALVPSLFQPGSEYGSASASGSGSVSGSGSGSVSSFALSSSSTHPSANTAALILSQPSLATATAAAAAAAVRVGDGTTLTSNTDVSQLLEILAERGDPPSFSSEAKAIMRSRAGTIVSVSSDTAADADTE